MKLTRRGRYKDSRAYASRLPQSCAATQDFFEKIAVERCGEALLGDAQLGGVSL